MEGDRIGPNRILTKIDQIIMAIKYTLRQKFMKSDQVNEVLERLSAWKKAFSKHKFLAGIPFQYVNVCITSVCSLIDVM